MAASERRSQLRNREIALAKNSPTSWQKDLLPKVPAAGQPMPQNTQQRSGSGSCAAKLGGEPVLARNV